MSTRLRFLVLAGCSGSAPASFLNSQEPAGLAARTLADSAMNWSRHEIPGFRVYFLAGYYALTHEDSLLAGLPDALIQARALIDAPQLAGPIDVFFIECREQMSALVGQSATGFAEPSTRTVVLVTNSEWRAFERHEIMHVVAGQAWGSPGPGTAWLREGLAQAADGECGAGYPNVDVLLALTERHGWIPLDVLLTRFRDQPDLLAYLQAAAFVDHLLWRYGPRVLQDLWPGGESLDSVIAGRTIADIESEWRAGLSPRRRVDPGTLMMIEADGCG